MNTKIGIGLLAVAAVIAWTGIAGAQAAPPAPKMQLPSEVAMWDLSEDWDIIVENLEKWAQDGTYPNVFRITQTGRAFSAIRLRDNPPPSRELAGTPSLQGELEKTGFKSVKSYKCTRNRRQL